VDELKIFSYVTVTLLYVRVLVHYFPATKRAVAVLYRVTDAYFSLLVIEPIKLGLPALVLTFGLQIPVQWILLALHKSSEVC